MSAGRGILHEEMPRRGPSGNIYGFQLWVNLPSHLKMSEPRYQEVTASTIPTYEKDGVKNPRRGWDCGRGHRSRGRHRRLASLHGRGAGPDTEWQFPIPDGHTSSPMFSRAKESSQMKL
jgi:redox-sensitive bicupin YhaK (pirin superfamily)